MKFIIYLFAVCFLITSCTNPEEANKVTATYNDYKAALINDDLDLAVDLVDQVTLDYYGSLLQNVQHSDSAALQSLDPMQKYFALVVRQQASREQILAFTPKSFLSYILKEDLEGKSRVTKNDIGKVKISSATATAPLIAGVKITTLNWTFAKEGEFWKINLIDLMYIVVENFDKMILKSQLDENNFLFRELEKRTGIKPDSTIWMPIKQ